MKEAFVLENQSLVDNESVEEANALDQQYYARVGHDQDETKSKEKLVTIQAQYIKETHLTQSW